MMILYTLAAIGLLCVVYMIAIMVTVLMSIHRSVRLVEVEPVRVDDLPIFECQECQTRWIEGTDPFHTVNCPVALSQKVKRRIAG